MLALWILCCVVLVCEGDDRFELSEAITTVPYGVGRIAVWRDEVVEGRYYMSPLALMLPDSAKIVDNMLTGKVFLHAHVLMWSIGTTEVVKNHLEVNLNVTVSAQDIQLVPIEKIRFSWSDRARPLVSPYQLIETWLSSADLPSVASFQISCRDTARCTALKTAINMDPDMLYALEMLYLTNPMSLGEVTVTGAHMARSGVYSEIAQMPVRGGVRYVTSDVADALAAQTVAAAVSSSLYDSVTAGDELALTNALKGFIKFHQVSTRAFTPVLWNSLFWRPAFARPDKISGYLNAVLKKDPNDTVNFMVDESRISDSPEHSACAFDLGLTKANLNLTKGNSSVYRIRRETVLAALRTKHVEWTGERFQARQMFVYRLNLAALNFSTSLVSGKVRMRELGAVKRVKVRAGNVTESQQLTPELVEARLKVQMKSLETKMNNARVKTEEEFNNVTSELRDVKQTTTNLKTEMNQTSMEIVNSTLKRVGSVFNGWPEYCRYSTTYCNSVQYTSHSSARTVGECKKVCDVTARCQGFNFYSAQSNRCYLLDYICPVDKVTSKSTNDLYIKLAHAPIVTTEMWRSVFTNNSLVNIPSDPCQLVGEYYTYTRV